MTTLSTSRKIGRSVIQGLDEPAPDWLWRAILPKLTVTTDSGTTKITSNGANTFIPESLSVPFLAMSAEPRFHGAAREYYPTSADMAPTTMTVYEDQNFSALNFLLLWKRLVRNENGVYGAPSVYKKGIDVEFYTRTDTTNYILKVTLNDCWPMEVHPYELNYTGNGRLVTTVTFSIKSASVKPGTANIKSVSAMIATLISVMSTGGLSLSGSTSMVEDDALTNASSYL